MAITAFIATTSCKKEVSDTNGLNTKGWGVMKFEETEHDFGEINATDKVEHTFKFVNTGQTDLLIKDAKGSCGCTVPEWSKEPIAPGKSGEIKVSFSPKGKNGDQTKSVTLEANTQKGAEIIKIKAKIIGGESGISASGKHKQ